jgi:hypothetical protein
MCGRREQRILRWTVRAKWRESLTRPGGGYRRMHGQYAKPRAYRCLSIPVRPEGLGHDLLPRDNTIELSSLQNDINIIRNQDANM